MSGVPVFPKRMRSLEIGGHDRRGIVLAGTKKRRRELAEAGIRITETGLVQRLRIDAADLPRALR